MSRIKLDCTAKGKHAWEYRDVASSNDCASVVGRPLKKFESGERDEHRMSTRRPCRAAESFAVLSHAENGSPLSHCYLPGDPRERFLPDKELLDAYSKCFGCNDSDGDPPTRNSGRCLACANVTREVSRVVECREAGAPEHSKGTVVMGSQLGEWTRVEDHNESPIVGAGGSDVEFSRDDDDET